MILTLIYISEMSFYFILFFLCIFPLWFFFSFFIYILQNDLFYSFTPAFPIGQVERIKIFEVWAHSSLLLTSLRREGSRQPYFGWLVEYILFIFIFCSIVSGIYSCPFLFLFFFLAKWNIFISMTTEASITKYLKFYQNFGQSA